MGSVEQWEMETLVFYSENHELDYYPLERLFELSNFDELPEEPVVFGYNNWKGRQWPKYRTATIAGVVVDKNKMKGLISVLTKSGVVTVRYTKGAFINYDKKVVEMDGKKRQCLTNRGLIVAQNLCLQVLDVARNLSLKRIIKNLHTITRLSRSTVSMVKNLTCNLRKEEHLNALLFFILFLTGINISI